MSEQQSGAGYPQQPTSGQPGQQQPYAQAPYASPQAQYQQQQYAAYAQPAGPGLFERLGVPSMPAILGLSGLGALVFAGLIGGTSSGGGGEEFGLEGTALSSFVERQIAGGVLSILVAVVVAFALALFTGERLRNLWKTLVLAGTAMFLAQALFTVLALGDGDSAADPSAWVALFLLICAYGLFVTGAILVPGKAAAAAPAAPAYPTGQQQAVPPAAAPQAQQNQWPQAPQQ